jgi:hypothetical protein
MKLLLLFALFSVLVALGGNTNHVGATYTPVEPEPLFCGGDFDTPPVNMSYSTTCPTGYSCINLLQLDPSVPRFGICQLPKPTPTPIPPEFVPGGGDL